MGVVDWLDADELDIIQGEWDRTKNTQSIGGLCRFACFLECEFDSGNVRPVLFPLILIKFNGNVPIDCLAVLIHFDEE